MLTSIYAQCFNSCYSRLKETKNFESFLDYFFEGSELYKALNYDYVFFEFKESFEQVKLMVYEELKNNEEGFLSELGSYIGVKIAADKLKEDNVRKAKGYKKVDDFSLSDLLGKIRQKIYFLRNIKFPLLRRAFHKVKLKKMTDVSKTIVINDERSAFIKDFYKGSNKKLEKNTGVDLTRNGYF
ncbi:hypothetical protein ATS71_10520 [Pseudoalteromonas sp. H71]|nr:hypothetical protein ATS71_10520 [Pseudoalteromonas sp. H71]